MRARWAAIGAAVAVSLGGGGLAVTQALVSDGVRSTYVPITPCRLMDTRAGTFTVGPRAVPIAAGESALFTVTGTNGQCTIPGDATAVVMNLTVTNGTQDGFVTVFPADAARPGTASVNWKANEIRQNQVPAKLSALGQVLIYNLQGTVDVIGDVVGYYVDHDHDDRYYTKAQVDAMAGPVRRTISLPAEALNQVSGTTRAGGMVILPQSTARANWALAKPSDFAGTGQVTLTITYSRLDEATGAVRWKAVPQDIAPGDFGGADLSEVTGDVQADAGGAAVRQGTVSWLASGETNPIWNIQIKRDTTIASAYAGSLLVLSVALSYDATR